MATLVVLLPLSVASAAKGGERSEPAADFWEEIIHPGVRAFRFALKEGKKSLALAHKDALRRGPLLQRAVRSFRRATAISPDHPRGHSWLGRALYETGNMRQAIGSLRRARALDERLLEDGDLAFALGVALCKVGAFRESVVEYDRALRLAGERSSRAGGDFRVTLQGNAAEALMAMGRLNEAIERYRQALALGEHHRLVWWGLAVALDRDEQRNAAMAALRRATAGDSELRALSGSGVFFVPAGDVHYYYALGHLAAGRTGSAEQSFGKFLAEVPNSPWSFRAREQLNRLRAGRASFEKAPSGGQLLLKRKRRGHEGEIGLRDRLRIRRAVAQRYDELRKCYRQALKQRPGLRGEVRVRLTVGAKGGKPIVQVDAGPAAGPQLRGCMRAHLGQIDFAPPSSGAKLSLTVPLELIPE